jgi:hypothetical protein
MPLISARLSITFWGDRDRGQGSQKSVIDSKRRRVKCLRPVRFGVTEKVQEREARAGWYSTASRNPLYRDLVRL